MNWYSITITKKMLLQGALHTFQEKYMRLRDAADFPSDMALFAGRQPELQDTYYFPRSSSQAELPLVSEYKAVACERPRKGEMILLVGNDKSDLLLG